MNPRDFVVITQALRRSREQKRKAWKNADHLRHRREYLEYKEREDRDAMEWRRSKRNRALVTLAAFVVGAIIVATFWALQWASTGHLPVWWRSL